MSCFFGTTQDEEDSDHDDDDSQEVPVEPFILRVAVGSRNPCKLQAVTQALQELLTIKKSAAAAAAAAAAASVTLDIQAFAVDSGVASQPFGDAETMQGAKNRAKAAYLAYRTANDGTSPHMAISMEGGLEWISMTTTSSDNEGGVSSNNNANGETGEDDDDGSKSTSNDTPQQPPASSNDTKSLFCMAWIAVYGKRTGSVLEVLCSDRVTAYTGDRRPMFSVARTASFTVPPSITKLVVEQGMELGDADNVVFARTHQQSKHGQGTVGILTDGIISRASYYEPAIVLSLTMWIRPDVYPMGFR